MRAVVIQVLGKLETNQKTLYVSHFWILHVTGLPAFVDVAVRLVDGSVSFPQQLNIAHLSFNFFTLFIWVRVSNFQTYKIPLIQGCLLL